jgi:hypothetical protein
MSSLSELNPDYIGWITIEGVIDYPIVLGKDNEHYLNITFSGRRNSAGTIFMDCRNKPGFEDTVCILYGHNMRDGSMFAPLKKYLNPAFLAANSTITVVTPEGKTLIYRIFAAELTDIWNSAYKLGNTDAQKAPAEESGSIDAREVPTEVTGSIDVRAASKDTSGSIDAQKAPTEENGTADIYEESMEVSDNTDAQETPAEFDSANYITCNYLLLSTCTTSTNKDDRLLIHAQLVQTLFLS